MTAPDTPGGHPPAHPFQPIPEITAMRTSPATPTEVDTWLAVLHRHGHLHRAEHGPGGTWTVQRTPHSRPWTLHHPVLAMDFIEDILREVRRQDAGPSR